jgi:hypothetical protein
LIHGAYNKFFFHFSGDENGKAFFPSKAGIIFPQDQGGAVAAKGEGV